MRWTPSRLPRCCSQNRCPNYTARTASHNASTLTPQHQHQGQHQHQHQHRHQDIATVLNRKPDQYGTLQPTRVIGTVRTIRNQKRRSFVEIGDGSTSRSLQALLEPHQAEGLGTGTLVALTGTWQRSPPGKEQEYELQVGELDIIGPTDAEKYPLQKKFHSAEYLRTIPHLRLRTPLNALLSRLKSECDYQLASYFRDRGFIRLQPPIITSSDCEGAGETFTVSSNAAAKHIAQADGSFSVGPDQFFREPKYLTVSSQLHLEAYMNEHSKVWTISPTFRAEKSDTSRHVSEFWMLEAEMRAEALSDIMKTVEDMIKHLLKKLRPTNLVQELVTLDRRDGIKDVESSRQVASLISERWSGLTERPWPSVTYSEAMEALESAAKSGAAEFVHSPTWQCGLQVEHERYIAKNYGQGSPVFVTNYPQLIKPFYMLPSDRESWYKSDQRATVACFDLILPDGCEVVGGSLREHRLDYLSHAMQMCGLKDGKINDGSSDLDARHPGEKSNQEWYLDLRRYGSAPHGGFGMGFDRLLGYLAGIPNIKDVITWPRYYGRCDC